MSRIGSKEIKIPAAVQVEYSKSGRCRVKGPKGVLERTLHSSMELKQEGDAVSVVPRNAKNPASNFQGLTRSLVYNMVAGVTTGFQKGLLLKGVGYRAAVEGRELRLSLGYSHQIVYKVPEGIETKVEKVGKDPSVIVQGIDKELVGQVAADIRAFRKPEPYHGKGVRYLEEVIKTKVGKTAGKK